MSIPKPVGKFVDKLLGIHWPTDGREEQFDAAAVHYGVQKQSVVSSADQLRSQAQSVAASSHSAWVDASVDGKQQLARSIENDVGGWLDALATQHRSIAATIRAGRSTLANLAEEGNAALEAIEAREQQAVQAGDAATAAEMRQLGVSFFISQAAAIATASAEAGAQAAGHIAPPQPSIFRPVSGPTGANSPGSGTPGGEWTWADAPQATAPPGSATQQVDNKPGTPYEQTPESPGERTTPESPNRGDPYTQNPDGKAGPDKATPDAKGGDGTGKGGDGTGSGPGQPYVQGAEKPTGTGSQVTPSTAPVSPLGGSAGSGLGAPSGGTPSAASLGSPASSLGSGAGKIPGAGLGSPSGTPSAASLGAGQVPSAGGAGAGSGSGAGGGSGSNSGVGALGRGFTPPVIPPAAVTQPQQQPTSGGVPGAAPSTPAPAVPPGSSVQPSAPAAAPASTGGGAMPMMTSPASPAAAPGAPLAPAGSAAPSATPIHQNPVASGTGAPASAAPGSPAAGGPGGVLSAGAGAAAGYHGAGPADQSSADLEVARAVLSALLVSTASYYTEFAVGVFAHAVSGRHVVVMSTSGRSYLPPTARVLPGVSIARTDPLAGDGWDGRFTNHSRPVDGLIAYSAATRDQLTWTAVATSESQDTKPPGIAFSRMSRPAGHSQPAAIPQGLHRLDATWPELARRTRDVAAVDRISVGARIVDQIIRSVPQSILEDADTAMISAIANGITAVPADQWEDYEGRLMMSIMSASLAGKSIGASSSAADAALGGEADATMQRMLVQEAVLCLRRAPGQVDLEDLVYIAMHLAIDPLEAFTPSM